MRLIHEARGKKPFATLFDFARRVDLKRVGKRSLEMLARAGAFDALDRNRARVFAALDALTAYSAAIHDAAASNQVSLFGEAGEDLPEPRLPNPDDWLPPNGSRASIPASASTSRATRSTTTCALRARACRRWPRSSKRCRAALRGEDGRGVSSRQERKSQKGNRFAFVFLSDPTGLYEVTMFSDVLEATRQHLETGSNILLQVEATLEADQLKLLCRGVQPIDTAVAQEATGLRVFVEDEIGIASVRSLLTRMAEDAARAARGPIHLCLMHPDLPGEVEMLLGEHFPVSPQIKGALRSMEGVITVEEV